MRERLKRSGNEVGEVGGSERRGEGGETVRVGVGGRCIMQVEKKVTFQIGHI